MIPKRLKFSIIFFNLSNSSSICRESESSVTTILLARTIRMSSITALCRHVEQLFIRTGQSLIHLNIRKDRSNSIFWCSLFILLKFHTTCLRIHLSPNKWPHFSETNRWSPVIWQSSKQMLHWVASSRSIPEIGRFCAILMIDNSLFYFYSSILSNEKLWNFTLVFEKFEYGFSQIKLLYLSTESVSGKLVNVCAFTILNFTFGCIIAQCMRLRLKNVVFGESDMNN